MNTIADKIMELRKNNETHKYMLMRGRYTYMRDIIYDRMTKIIGSPNSISHSAICAEAEKFGPYYTEGYWDYRQYDVVNTKYILIWGADPLAANRQVSYYSSVWGDVVGKARIAVVEPQAFGHRRQGRRVAAGQARSGRSTGCGHRPRAADQGVLEQGIRGRFQGGKNRFIPGQEVNPEDVRGEAHLRDCQVLEPGAQGQDARSGRRRTGLPVEQIRRVAMDYGKAGSQSISWLGGGPSMQVRGAYASMTIHALNGITGACDNVGGTLVSNKEYTEHFPEPDEFHGRDCQEGQEISRRSTTAAARNGPASTRENQAARW